MEKSVRRNDRGVRIMFTGIKRNLFILLLIPNIVVAVLAVITMGVEWEIRTRVTASLPIVDVTSSGGDLTHELQYERGIAVKAITDGYDSSTMSALSQQRLKTDQAKDSLLKLIEIASEQTLPERFVKQEKKVQSLLPSLDQVRSTFDGRQSQLEDMIKSYSEIIKGLEKL